MQFSNVLCYYLRNTTTIVVIVVVVVLLYRRWHARDFYCDFIPRLRKGDTERFQMFGGLSAEPGRYYLLVMSAWFSEPRSKVSDSLGQNHCKRQNYPCFHRRGGQGEPGSVSTEYSRRCGSSLVPGALRRPVLNVSTGLRSGPQGPGDSG